MLLPSPTDRLILHCWQDEDFPAFARMNADSRVMEYFPAPLSLPESAAFFDRIRREFETERFGLYALERRTDGELLGYTGLHRVRPGPEHRTGNLSNIPTTVVTEYSIGQDRKRVPVPASRPKL